MRFIWCRKICSMFNLRSDRFWIGEQSSSLPCVSLSRAVLRILLWYSTFKSTLVTSPGIQCWISSVPSEKKKAALGKLRLHWRISVPNVFVAAKWALNVFHQLNNGYISEAELEFSRQFVNRHLWVIIEIGDNATKTHAVVTLEMTVFLEQQ